MKRTLSALALLAGLALSARADTITDAGGSIVTPTFDASHTAHAHLFCQITVGTSAQSLATLWAASASANSCQSIPSNGQLAFIQPLTGTVWYRADGVAPTTSVGMQVAQGTQAWPIEGRLSIAGLQLIASASTTVNIEIRY